MKYFIVFFSFLLFFLISACSFSSQVTRPSNENITYELNDYRDNLKYIGSQFLKDNSRKIIKLNTFDKTYLTSLAKKILQNNELFFQTDKELSFYIIKSDIPYYFSLPENKIVLSLKLFKKYIITEDQLASIISYELIKSDKLLYMKKIIIPSGPLGLRGMLKLTRLPYSERLEVNKWNFYILKRSGFDPDVVLSWIQVMNRNSYDFSYQVRSVRDISREEVLFKSFLAKYNNRKSLDKNQRNSSNEFYQFINKVKKVTK